MVCNIIIFVYDVHVYNMCCVCLELFKKMKSQGSRKHSTSNVKAEEQNAKKRKDTPPGIYSK